MFFDKKTCEIMHIVHFFVEFAKVNSQEKFKIGQSQCFATVTMYASRKSMQEKLEEKTVTIYMF